MKNSAAFLLFCALLGTLHMSGGYCSPPATAPAQENLFAPTARTVVFPDTVVGQFIISRSVREKNGLEVMHSRALPARGRVMVDIYSSTKLCVARAAIDRPELLDQLPITGIDNIELRFASMNASEDGLLDRALTHLARLKSLKGLYISRSDAGDSGLSALGGLTELRILEGGFCSIHGEFLKNWNALKKLRNLRLSGNELHEASLANLKQLTGLRQLSLARCRLSAEGLRQVAACTQIYELDISQNPRIGDSELTLIAPLKKLLFLDLEGTNVTAAGIRKLQGLGLMELVLPRENYSPSEMETFRRMFPGTNVKAARRATKEKAAETEDMKTILAPTSRN